MAMICQVYPLYIEDPLKYSTHNIKSMNFYLKFAGEPSDLLKVRFIDSSCKVVMDGSKKNETPPPF